MIGCVHMHASAEEDTRSPEAGVTGACELPTVVSEN